MCLFFGSHSPLLLLLQSDCVYVFKGVDLVVTEQVALQTWFGTWENKTHRISHESCGK